MLACLAATIGMAPDLFLSFVTDETTDHLVTPTAYTMSCWATGQTIYSVADTALFIC